MNHDPHTSTLKPHPSTSTSTRLLKPIDNFNTLIIHFTTKQLFGAKSVVRWGEKRALQCSFFKVANNKNDGKVEQVKIGERGETSVNICRCNHPHYYIDNNTIQYNKPTPTPTPTLTVTPTPISYIRN